MPPAKVASFEGYGESMTDERAVRAHDLFWWRSEVDGVQTSVSVYWPALRDEPGTTARLRWFDASGTLAAEHRQPLPGGTHLVVSRVRASGAGTDRDRDWRVATAHCGLERIDAAGLNRSTPSTRRVRGTRRAHTARRTRARSLPGRSSCRPS